MLIIIAIMGYKESLDKLYSVVGQFAFIGCVAYALTQLLEWYARRQTRKRLPSASTTLSEGPPAPVASGPGQKVAQQDTTPAFDEVREGYHVARSGEVDGLEIRADGYDLGCSGQ